VGCILAPLCGCSHRFLFRVALKSEVFRPSLFHREAENPIFTQMLKRRATQKQSPQKRSLGRRGRDFYAGVGVAPEEGKSGKPVFLFDQLAHAGKLFGRQNAGGGGEFGTGDFSTDHARGDLDLRVIAEALALASFAVGREKEFVRVFGKPDGSVDGDSALAEGSKADVTLAVDCGGDGGHWSIVKGCEGRCRVFA
jgi:hypothetical protein